MYRDHCRCRACNSRNLIPVFDLGFQPLANDFRKPGEERAGFAPLKVLFCKNCSLAQLSVVVSPSVLYDNYSYVTSNSETMRQHFLSLSADIEAETGFGTVVEIGSNDGALGKFLKAAGFHSIVGIDPAENLANVAMDRGIKTITALFDRDSAKDAKQILGDVDIVIARHVFAHVDNWHEFIGAIEEMSDSETLVCIECPYCLDMLQKREWDTIYHEHLSYVTVKAVNMLLSETAFHLHKIIKYPIHGGSLMMMLRRNDHASIRHVSVDEYLASENITPETWKQFAVESQPQICDLQHYARKLVESGQTVVGFGASAKSTVVLNACRLDNDTVRYVTDTTPLKQGRLCPGTKIPILPEEELLKQQPDYAICFAWNFRDEILKKCKAYREAGGKFIFFVPKLEVI